MLSYREIHSTSCQKLFRRNFNRNLANKVISNYNAYRWVFQMLKYYNKSASAAAMCHFPIGPLMDLNGLSVHHYPEAHCWHCRNVSLISYNAMKFTGLKLYIGYVHMFENVSGCDFHRLELHPELWWLRPERDRHKLGLGITLAHPHPFENHGCYSMFDRFPGDAYQ